MLDPDFHELLQDLLEKMKEHELAERAFLTGVRVASDLYNRHWWSKRTASDSAFPRRRRLSIRKPTAENTRVIREAKPDPSQDGSAGDAQKNPQANGRRAKALAARPAGHPQDRKAAKRRANRKGPKRRK
jgi:hypothetical protein